MRNLLLAGVLVLASSALLHAQPKTPNHGQAIELDRAIPANERGILCLAIGKNGEIFGGTTGRAAHLFVYDAKLGEPKSLVRLEGGIGLAYEMIVLPDNSIIVGTQADPTGTAVKTDPQAVGRLLRIVPGSKTKVEELGIPVPGQGIYTLAYLPEAGQVVGNTWPDGHFFSLDLKSKDLKDHGPIAGFRTFETPRHAEDLNKGTKENIHYPRQVSRAIAVDPRFGALTGGDKGLFVRYDPQSRKIEKLKLQMPAIPGREPWTSLDRAVIYPRESSEKGGYTCVVGGTSDGYLFELRWFDDKTQQLRSRGRPLLQGTIQGLAKLSDADNPKSHALWGIGGPFWSLPRTFTFSHGGGSSSLDPGPVPSVENTPSMVGFGALIAAPDGTLFAGEQDRIARLIRYEYRQPEKKLPRPKLPLPKKIDPPAETLSPLDAWVVFAPEGTTTDGSGYTAISVGLDGNVYIGGARYGGYAYLMRFDPTRRAFFMDRVLNVRDITGEFLQGINTQGKIHAIIIVGPDGRIWFATKQAHEIFGTRPEIGDPEGYPGGHLLSYDPKTGFARTHGILKKQEGLMAGAMDKKRNILYYRSEPRNYFLSYNITTGQVKELGHIGANCRYMAIDDKGIVYQPGRGNYLARFDPDTGYVEDLAIQFEGEGNYAAPYVIQIGPNGKLYGIGTHHPYVLEYDIDRIKPGPFGEITVRNVARVAPEGLPVQDIHSAIFGKDGKLYYPLVTTAANLEGKIAKHIRIMRFDPIAKKTETVGIPRVQVDEEKVKHSYNRGSKYEFDHTQGMVVTNDGTLVVMDIYPQLNAVVFPRLTAGKK